jgi:DHA1 family bicyclomycin/chloramphenicol resistance-like MFS transporter
VLCGLAATFTMLLAARTCQGAAAAASRVLVVAMVRDLFEGEAMARVMSLVFMTFMLVPVLAPNIGQAILAVGSWRAIFLMLALYAFAMLVWSGMRLPETLRSEHRRSLHWRRIAEAATITVSDPQSRGYTIALTLTFGALVAYISSIQQIVFDAFHAGRFIGLVFASIAAPMALASWTNSRIVGRFGLRRVAHSGAAVFAAITLVHAALGASGVESLLSFIILQALAMGCFAFTSSNLSTLAMEHMAKIAGTASSVQGLVSTIGGAMIGYMIGQAFNGTPRPFLVGVAVSATLAFLAVIATEPKRLFARLEPRLPAADEIC